MRRLVPLLGVLALAVLWPVPASAADAKLALSPAHGQANAEFTATYHGETWSNGSCRVAGWVVFSWDGTQLNSGAAIPLQNCRASLNITPLQGKNSPGQHTVKGVRTTGFGAATPTYTVDVKPAPSPTPTLKPSPTLNPSATAKPPANPRPTTQPTTQPTKPLPVTPGLSASPGVTVAPTPPVGQTEGAEVSCSPMDTPRTEPGAELLPLNVPVSNLKPSSLLPAIVDFSGLPAVLLTIPVGESLQPFQEAMSTGTTFPCLHLNLGPTDSYQFASYALRNVGVSAVEISDSATVKLSYASASWRYQLVASDLIVTGGTDQPKSTATSNAFSIVMYVISGLLLIGGGAAYWVLRRRRLTL